MRKPKDFAGHWMPFPARPEFRAVVKHIVDGDTLDVFIDAGLYKYAYESIRLNGVDAPEINSGTEEEKERGRAARARVQELVMGQQVRVVTYKDTTSFGRFVADIYYRDADGVTRSLAATLIEEGHSK